MRDNGAGDELPIWGVRPAGPTRLSMKEERNPKTPRAFRAKEEECNTGEHLGGTLSFSSLTEFESQKVPEWYLRPMQGGLQSKTPTHLGGGAGQRPPASAQHSEYSSGQTLEEAAGARQPGRSRQAWETHLAEIAVWPSEWQVQVPRRVSRDSMWQRPWAW